MSDGISIPISVPGADLAKVALEQIINSFTGLDREVIKTAQSSEATKEAFENLKAQFTTGAISAAEFRDTLSGIAAQSAQVSDQVRASGAAVTGVGSHLQGATEKTRTFKDALVDAKDAGLEELSQKAGELGQRIGGVGGQIAEIAIKSAAAFGPLGIAITAVGAALAFAAQAYDEHAAKVALANARTEELTSSVSTLGTTYPSMTAAVEGATTAVQVHTAAVAENQRILGQQLTLLNTGFSAQQAQTYTLQLQQVSGAVRELGTYLHGASEEQIRQALETGNAAAQQELLGLSFTHSTNAATEANNRVDAMIVLHQRAAVAIAASKEEALANARATLESARANLNDAASIEDADARRAEMASAARQVTEATQALTVAQERAAAAHREVASGADAATRAEDALAAANEAAAATAEAAALQRGYAAITRIAHEREQRQHSAAHATAQHRDSLAELKQKNDREDAAIRGQEAALRARYAAERDEIARTREAAVDAMIERARLDEEGKRHAIQNEVDRAKAVSLAGRRAAAATQREEGRQAAGATLADLRDPAVQREQLDAARMDRTIARERRALDRRADQQQTFTERMRDYYQSDVSAAEEAATGLQGAFTATGEAFAAHVEEFAAGRETMAEALQGMAADALKAIGKQALTKSAYFFAEGLGNLALFNFPGAATAFAASAAYAAIGGGAVALGTAITEPPEAKLAGREEAARKAEQDRTKPQRAETGTGSRGGKGGEGEGITYNISFGGPMYGTGGVRQAARQMVGAINRGGIQGGVQILPGVLQSTGAGS